MPVESFLQTKYLAIQRQLPPLGIQGQHDEGPHQLAQVPQGTDTQAGRRRLQRVREEHPGVYETRGAEAGRRRPQDQGGAREGVREDLDHEGRNQSAPVAEGNRRNTRH